MKFPVKTEGEFTYLDQGPPGGEVLLLLHGLFGALSNWDAFVTAFRTDYRVVIPVMPIYDMPRETASLEGLVAFIEAFVDRYQLRDLTLLGNSLGGHVGLLYALRNQPNVRKLVLTGSSGLFENSMGGSFPKRGTYDYIRERVAYTFYDPATASEELVNEVFEITNSISKCMNIVSIAKSAQRQNLATELSGITVPTLLIWGLNDTITPPHVAYEFNKLLPHSQLHFLDHCCHAPMMEQPDKFNRLVSRFLHPIAVPLAAQPV